MTPSTALSTWKDLFRGGENVPAGAVIQVSVFNKAGHPLLIVPRGVPPGPALCLYAAQTALAKAARIAWRIGLSCRLPIGSVADSVQVNPEQPFMRFLRSLAPGREIPAFSILAGNPHAPGRRFLFLLFDAHGRPVAVIKAGIGPQAGDLIRKEILFLERVPPGTFGMPKFSGTFFDEYISAFAMNFVEGRAPLRRESEGIGLILNAWLKRKERVKLNTIPAWLRLAAAAGEDPLFASLDQKLRSLEVCPALFHGDLAPWNIKISSQDESWTVLDWERGEAQGPPGWDWFHYIVQTEILARKRSARTVAKVTDGLVASDGFRRYASDAGIAGYERDFLLSYLLHCRDVLRPAEGSPRVRELIEIYKQR